MLSSNFFVLYHMRVSNWKRLSGDAKTNYQRQGFDKLSLTLLNTVTLSLSKGKHDMDKLPITSTVLLSLNSKFRVPKGNLSRTAGNAGMIKIPASGGDLNQNNFKKYA